MSKYQELCHLAFQWQAEADNNWIRLGRATFRLTRGFAKYIDATGTYPDPKTGYRRYYVETMRHGQRRDGTSVPVQVESDMDALDVESDGTARFSIAVAFKCGPEIYPKMRVGVFLKMKITGDTIHIELFTRSKNIPFTIDINDTSTHETLFEAMVELLEKSFKMRNDDAPSIGFDLTSGSDSSIF
jgi:hypothetical protein